VFSRLCYGAVRLVLYIGSVRLGKREFYLVHSLADHIHEYLLNSGVDHEEMVGFLHRGKAKRDGRALR
jgi:hypothetical protein